MKPEIKVGTRRTCQRCAAARMTCSQCGAKCCSHRLASWTPGADNAVCDVCDPPRRTNAPPEAKATGPLELHRRCAKCDAVFSAPAKEVVYYCDDCAGPRVAAVSPSAPSPLEVVRAALELLGDQPGLSATGRVGLAALATLEESIRRDETEMCAKVAARFSIDAAAHIRSRR